MKAWAVVMLQLWKTSWPQRDRWRATSEQEVKWKLGKRDGGEDCVKHCLVTHIFLLIPFELIFFHQVECHLNVRHRAREGFSTPSPIVSLHSDHTHNSLVNLQLPAGHRGPRRLSPVHLFTTGSDPPPHRPHPNQGLQRGGKGKLNLLSRCSQAKRGPQMTSMDGDASLYIHPFRLVKAANVWEWCNNTGVFNHKQLITV